ncbi:hypothetical protein [Candidatus Nanohalovita haloferacivicina]|uniref:hypothetical protein n=1 Tax=Candidatus Nanohalovita haloferacivicina TaxID=2978046 RepID=UPI00325FBF49|nr:hypothetical protein HBNXNv_0799 [Candidatus Nanohalobia archaeon BNXNv]
MRRKTTSWSRNRNKARLEVTLPKGLKKQVTQTLKYSSLTRSDLVEEKFREFLREQKNTEIIHDKHGEFSCRCGAIMTEAVLDKNNGKCPSCRNKIEER